MPSVKLTKKWGAVKRSGKYVKYGEWEEVSLVDGDDLEQYDAPVKSIIDGIVASDKTASDKYKADRATAIGKIKTQCGLTDAEVKLVFGG